MILDNYVKLACVTESPVTAVNTNIRVLHSIMGISTEIGELISHTDNVNFNEEVGDIFWYIAIACDELRINFKELVTAFSSYRIEAFYDSKEAILNKLIITTSEALDKLKKNIFYGKEIINIEEDIEHIIRWLIYLITFENENVSIEEILEKNINKLKARYGGKFEAFFAINRNLDTERKVLE
jgi:NTP pyrophosphatase (non-canonical NTP hydrolase)